MALNLASFLSSGYGAEQIMQFVDRIFPNIARAAKSAQRTGKSAEDIIRVLSQLSPKQLKKADKNAERLNFDNPLERATAAARSEEGNPVLQGAKDLGKAGLLAAGTLGAARALPAIGQAISGNLGSQQNQNPSLIPPTPYQSTIQPSMQEGNIPQMQPGQAIPVRGVQQMQRQMQSTSQQQPQQQAQQINQPELAIEPQQPPNLDSASIIKQMQLEPKINNLLASGNSPEVIGAVLEQSLKPGEKKWLDNQIKEGKASSLPEMVKDYITKQSQTPSIAMPEQPKKPVKGEMVATPQGIVGELKSIRDKEALIEDNGKLHKVKVDEMMQSPLPEKDLADLYEDLIRGIEKESGEEVSRSVEWAGYDPESNTLAYKPHAGPVYNYADISPEDVKFLTSILSTRKTTGASSIGAWEKGTKSPFGAAMSAFIRKLQAERGGKGNEYEAKFETIYAAHEAAQQAHKKKKRKKP